MKKVLVLFICFVLLTACKFGEREETRIQYINNLYYVKFYDNQCFITDRDKKVNFKIPNMKRITDFKISPDGSNILLGGTGVEKDEANREKLYLINDKKELIKLTDDYLSIYPKWSSDGKHIAYMPYTSDDPSSGQGINIIDLQGHKINITGDKLISKPLYTWLDNSNLVYFGMDVANKNLRNIYRYNINENKEYIFYDNISGYCDFMTINNDGSRLLLVEGNGLNKTLKLADLNLKKDRKINLLFYDFFGAKFSTDNKYIAIVANQTEDDKPHLFIYDIDNDINYMATIDFPEKISTRTDYMYWNGNIVYFMGESGTESIYSYNLNTKEIKLETEVNTKCFFPQFIVK